MPKLIYDIPDKINEGEKLQKANKRNDGPGRFINVECIMHIDVGQAFIEKAFDNCV